MKTKEKHKQKTNGAKKLPRTGPSFQKGELRPLCLTDPTNERKPVLIKLFFFKTIKKQSQILIIIEYTSSYFKVLLSFLFRQLFRKATGKASRTVF